MSSYNHLEVPEDPKENAEWREETLRLASQNHPAAQKFREQILHKCRKDFFYWARGFAYVHEPRILDDEAEVFNTRVPFLPWNHQVPVIKALLAGLGKRDARIVKSRAQGASWIIVLIFIWCWLFKRGFKGNIVSKDEVAVDRRGDMDSVMAKALTLDTPVLTPSGWVNNGDLSVGDMVIGSDGRPTRVLAVHDHGAKEVYRVTFSDGTSVRCCGDHLWTVTSRSDRCSARRFTREQCPIHTLTTRELAETVVCKPGQMHPCNTSGYTGVTKLKTGWQAKIITNGKQVYLGCYDTPEAASRAYMEAKEGYRTPAKQQTRQHNYQIPIPSPMEFTLGEPLPIPAYTLGALLGDGCLSKTCVEISGKDDEVFDRMREELPECQFRRQAHGGFVISSGALSMRLRSVGVRGKRAWEKSVPRQYLFASRADRLALLQGLMDTDGTTYGFVSSFTSTSEQLAKDVAFLVRSLGGRATEPNSIATTYSYNGEVRQGRTAYEVSITAPFQPFHLSRKRALYKPRKPRDKVIVRIERDGHEPVRCITVDAKDHLYIVDGVVLTHNCDWLIEQLPLWMTGVKNKDWKRNFGEHSLARTDGETAITGYSCTGDVASGGRAMVFALDEHGKHPRGPDKEALASTQPITRCRWFISTPRGKSGAYYDICHDDTIEEPVLYLSWRDNPTQNQGLYRIVKGKPEPVDEKKYGPLFPEYQDHEQWVTLKERLNERGYDLTSGETRSRWYDQECLRPGANPVLVAQEYDMVFGAEGAQYFAEHLINRLKNNVRRPLRGEFNVNPESLTGTWTENPDGRFKLWCELDIRRVPPMGEYIIGCDVSSGIGGSQTSNSAICIFNRKTGTKVGSFASPAVVPYELAEIAIALCRWFVNHRGDPAFLIWEANGYGQEFKQRVERSDFKNYYRRKTKDSPLHSRHTDKAGYWTYKRSFLLGPYREALLEGYFDNPEWESIEELRQYQMGQDGEPYHVGETDRDDPAGAKGAHGDRIVAEALAWEASVNFGDTFEKSGKRNINVMNVKEQDVSKNSYAWRRAQYLKMLGKDKKKANW